MRPVAAMELVATERKVALKSTRLEPLKRKRSVWRWMYRDISFAVSTNKRMTHVMDKALKKGDE
jgi:hypothetical protein